MKKYILLLLTSCLSFGQVLTPVPTVKTAINVNQDFKNASKIYNGTLVNFPDENVTTAQMNAISPVKLGRWVYNTTRNNPYYFNGTIWVEVDASNFIKGTLTTSFIPKAIDSKTIGDGIMADNGSRIRILTANTPYLNITDGVGFANFGIYTALGNSVFFNTNTFYGFQTNSGEKLRINNDGTLNLFTSPTTSASTYDVLTRNTSTGAIEKKSSSSFQAPISLTTLGSSGASTLIGNTLNIPNYTSGTSVLNITSATSPDLITPANNLVNINTMVTVTSGVDTGDIFFIDNIGVAVKVYDAVTPIITPLSTVVSIGTQAQLNAIVTKELNGLYILNDVSGAYQGDILIWSDTDGDDIGDSFLLSQAMTVDGKQKTVLTNDSGASAGVYEYDLITDSWTLISGTAPLTSESGTAVGGVKFPTRYLGWKSETASTFILGNSVAGVGKSLSHLTDNGSIVAPTTTTTDTGQGDVRKSNFTYYQLDTPFSKIVSYDPSFVDVQGNSTGGVALDNLGGIWWKGTAGYMNNMTGVDSKTSSVIASAFVPDAFIAGLPSKIMKINHSFNTNNVIVITADGKVYFKGAGGTNGVYGDGTIVANDLWHKWNIPQQEYIKCVVSPDGSYAGVLSASGDLYMAGLNNSFRFLAGASAVYSTPVITQTNIKDFDLLGQNTSCIKFDGSRSFIGVNTNGQSGEGGIFNKSVWTNITSPILYKKIFGTAVDNAGNLTAYTYISTDDKAYYSGFNNGAMGDGVGTGNVVVPTLMGTGAYQGTVIDIRCYTNSSLIHTNQGTVWTSVKTAGSNSGENGWGTNNVTTNGTGLAVFKQVPITGIVQDIQSSTNATNGVQYSALAKVEDGSGGYTGAVYSWGIADMSENGSEIRFAPYELGIGKYRAITPKNLSLVYNITGSVIGLGSSGTATNSLDNAPMTVTFSVPASGTVSGNISPITVTTPYTYATISNISQGYFNALTSMVTFTATVTNTDNLTLNAPDTTPITYNVTYGASTVPVTGIVHTDPMYAVLQGTNLTTYVASTTGEMVGIELTATELATAKTILTTWGALAMNTADAAGTGTNSFIGFNNQTVANSIVATQIPTAKRIYIVGASSSMTYVAGSNTIAFKVYDSGLTAGVNLGVIPATTPTYGLTTGVSAGVHFFTYKGGYLTTATSQLAVVTNVNQICGQTTGGGAPKYAAGNVTTALTTAGAAAYVISLQALGL